MTFGRRPGTAVRSVVAALLTALTLVACSTGDDPGGPAATTPAGAPSGTAQGAGAARTRCGPPQTGATLVSFTAPDGTGLDGVMVGSGTTGVVLVHQSQPDDLCGFWPFATYLAAHHVRAFAIDLRCFGRSACPSGAAAGQVLQDVAAAATELRRRGATTVAVVGASMGGAAALIAGTRIRPPLAAVVSLSGETDPTDLVGIPLDAGAATPQLRVPTMLVVATHDQYVSVEQTRTMYGTIRTDDKRLVVLSGAFDTRHGLELLTSDGGFTSVAAQVLAFVTTHR